MLSSLQQFNVRNTVLKFSFVFHCVNFKISMRKTSLFYWVYLKFFWRRESIRQGIYDKISLFEVQNIYFAASLTIFICTNHTHNMYKMELNYSWLHLILGYCAFQYFTASIRIYLITVFDLPFDPSFHNSRWCKHQDK